MFPPSTKMLRIMAGRCKMGRETEKSGMANNIEAVSGSGEIVNYSVFCSNIIERYFALYSAVRR
jgi:hypothetical protein